MRRRNNIGQFQAEENLPRFWRSVKKIDGGCWEWTGIKDHKGYGQFQESYFNGVKRAQKHRKAHRFSFSIKNGEIPKGMIICHKCDNPCCVNPDHLFMGTDKTNKEDCVSKVRHAFGEKSGMAKLNEAEVIQIRQIDQAGVRTRLSIAAQFKISGRMVTSICRYDNWKHLP